MTKLRSVLGFWAVLLNSIALLFTILGILFIVLRISEEIAIIILFLGVLIDWFLPLIALGFSISGLMKDKSKKLAIISLIMSIILVILWILFFSLVLRSGRAINFLS